MSLVKKMQKKYETIAAASKTIYIIENDHQMAAPSAYTKKADAEKYMEKARGYNKHPKVRAIDLYDSFEG